MNEPAPHPTVGLSDLVHQRVRLGILVILAEISECAFGTLRDQLQVTDGNLNRHLQALDDAGLVTVSKGYDGKRPRTWVKLTRDGRRALRQELSSLERLVQQLNDTDIASEP